MSAISRKLLLMFWASLKALIQLQITIIKEIFKMTFTKKNTIPQSYAILILAGEMTIDRVPNIWNLRAIVLEILSGE